MDRQLLVRGEKLTALLLQKPLGRQTRAPFPDQSLRKIHHPLPTSCLPTGPLPGFHDTPCNVKVNQRLTTPGGTGLASKGRAMRHFRR